MGVYKHFAACKNLSSHLTYSDARAESTCELHFMDFTNNILFNVGYANIGDAWHTSEYCSILWLKSNTQ